MSARSGSPSFLRETAFGLVASVLAAVLAATLTLFLPAGTVVRALVAGLALTLVLRTIAHSNERTGRVVTLAVWLAVTAGAWLSGIGLPAYIAAQVLIVWLVRSLFACSRPIEAGFELALTLLAASFATVAAVRTGSVFLASWSFLLVAAIGVAIPALAAKLTAPREEPLAGDDPNRGFAEALKAAEQALTRLAARPHG